VPFVEEIDEGVVVAPARQALDDVHALGSPPLGVQEEEDVGTQGYGGATVRPPQRTAAREGSKEGEGNERGKDDEELGAALL
jgi:hypothetical protein